MDLGKDNLLGLLMKFSVPAIIGMLVNALYNMVDRIFISYGVGSNAFSSLSVTGPLMNILIAFNLLVGIGAAASISIKLGEGDKEEAERILANAFLMLFLTSFIVMFLGLLFLEPILYIFGASKEGTIGYAMDYMKIILYGFPFATVGFGLYHMTRASGQPTKAMFSMILGAALNVALDAVFIFGFHLGIKGAAYATIISQAVSMIFVLYFFVNKKSELRLRLKNLKPKRKTLARIYAIGLSPFITQLAASGVGAFANNLLLFYGGDDAIGAFGAVNMVTMLFFMPILGMNQGAQPVLGFNYGAKKYNRVKKALFYTIMIACGIGVLGFIFTTAFSYEVINMFTNGHEGINMYAVPALKTIMFLFPFAGMQIAGSVFFQALGKAKTALFLSMLRQVILLIPLYYILPHFFGIEGIWYSIPISDGIAFIITMLVLYLGLRSLKKEELEITGNTETLSNSLPIV